MKLFLRALCALAVACLPAFAQNGADPLGWTRGAAYASGSVVVYGGQFCTSQMPNNSQSPSDPVAWSCAALGGGLSAQQQTQLNSAAVQSNQLGKNARVYGLIADGTSHPASTEFASLAACQAAYPTCASLNDEMDTLAIESAIAAATSQANGNDMLILPAGTYTLSRPILVRNDTRNTVPSGSSVSIRGAGKNATMLQPDAAMLASGQPLIACGNGLSDTVSSGTGRYSRTENGCSGEYSGFTLRSCAGFSAAQYSGNAPNCGGTAVTGDGMLLGGRMHLSDIVVEGFVHGLNLVGDHQLWTRVLLEYNQDGVYLAPENTAFYGDLAWNEVTISANTRSAVRVSKDAYLNLAATGGQSYLSGSPWAITGEAGTPDSYINAPFLPIVLNSQFSNILSEFIGNGFILDENALGNGTAIRDVTKTKFGAMALIGGGTALANQPVTWFDVASMDGVEMDFQSNDIAILPNMTGVITTQNVTHYFGGLDIKLNSVTLNNLGNIPLVGGFSGNVNNPACASVRIHVLGMWDGTCLNIPTAGSYHNALTALPQGTVMTDFYGTQGIADGANGDPIHIPSGVNMQPWTSGAVNGNTTVIAIHGQISGIPYNTVPPSSGGLMKADTNGAVVPCTSTSSLCTDGFPVGQVVGWNTGNQTTTLRLTSLF